MFNLNGGKPRGNKGGKREGLGELGEAEIINKYILDLGDWA